MSTDDLNELAAQMGVSMDATPAADVGLDFTDSSSAPGSAEIGEPSPNAAQVTSYDQWRADALVKESTGLQNLGIGVPAVEDFFALTYQRKPELTPVCEDEHRHQFCKELLADPDFTALRGNTAGRDDVASLALNHIAMRYRKALDEKAKKEKERKKERGKKPPSNAQKQQDAAEDAAATIIAAGEATKQAQQEVDSYLDAARAFGLDGDGQGGSIDAKRAMALFSQVRNTQKLRRIAEQAGRFRTVARAKQQTKCDHGIDQVCGIELGNDIPRLLTSEAAPLVDEDDRSWAQWAKFMDRSLLSVKMSGTKKVGRGPIIVAIDESGSMASNVPGQPYTFEEMAKAFALSLVWVARSQKRFCALVSWSSSGQVRTLVIPPGKTDEGALLQWLTLFWNGGTEPPLKEMPGIYQEVKAPKGKTDIILVTDGVCSIDPKVQLAFNGWKKESQARMITLALTFGHDIGQTGLEAVSDDVHKVSAITADGNAVGQALSI